MACQQQVAAGQFAGATHPWGLLGEEKQGICLLASASAVAASQSVTVDVCSALGGRGVAFCMVVSCAQIEVVPSVCVPNEFLS